MGAGRPTQMAAASLPRMPGGLLRRRSRSRSPIARHSWSPVACRAWSVAFLPVSSGRLLVTCHLSPMVACHSRPHVASRSLPGSLPIGHRSRSRSRSPEKQCRMLRAARCPPHPLDTDRQRARPLAMTAASADGHARQPTRVPAACRLPPAPCRLLPPTGRWSHMAGCLPPIARHSALAAHGRSRAAHTSSHTTSPHTHRPHTSPHIHRPTWPAACHLLYMDRCLLHTAHCTLHIVYCSSYIAHARSLAIRRTPPVAGHSPPAVCVFKLPSHHPRVSCVILHHATRPISCASCAVTRYPLAVSPAHPGQKDLPKCTAHTIHTQSPICCLCTRSVCLAVFVVCVILSPCLMRTLVNDYYTKTHKNTFPNAPHTPFTHSCASFVFAQDRFVSPFLSYTRSIRRILCALWPMSTTPRHTKTLSKPHRLHYSYAVGHVAHLLSLHDIGLSRSFCHIRDPFAVSHAHSGQ